MQHTCALESVPVAGVDSFWLFPRISLVPIGGSVHIVDISIDRIPSHSRTG
jgi:hypothetical protein